MGCFQVEVCDGVCSRCCLSLIELEKCLCEFEGGHSGLDGWTRWFDQLLDVLEKRGMDFFTLRNWLLCGVGFWVVNYYHVARNKVYHRVTHQFTKACH